MPDTVLTADVWPPDTQVQLLSVPWDESYRDVVAWDASTRDKWFEEHLTSSWVGVNFTYLRPGEPVKVPVPYSTAYRYNYLVVTNPSQPVDDEGEGRTFYYFVTGVSYLSPQATMLTVMLDVMTSYAGKIELGRAFVESGHVALAECKAVGDDYARSHILDLPEGLDVGSAYVPKHREFKSLLDTGDSYKLVVISTADLTANPGTTSSPNLNVAAGQVVDGLPSGCKVYAFDAEKVTTFMAQMQSKSWVAQCIIALYAFPGSLLQLGASVNLFGGSFSMNELGGTYTYGESAQPTAFSVSDIASKLLPDGVTAYDPKLTTYPYSVIELSTFNGSPIYLKPQLCYGNDLTFHYIGCALLPFAKAGFYPEGYGAPESYVESVATFQADTIDGQTRTLSIPSGDFIDSSVWVTDFPQFSLVNNNYYVYLASTVNTRNASYAGAGWTNTAAGLTAENAFNTSINSAYGSLQNEINTLKQDASNLQATGAAGAVSTAIGLTGGGIAAGLGLGIGSGEGISLLTTTAQNAVTGAVELSNAGASNRVAQAAAQNTYARTAKNIGANLDLANQVRQGNYEQAVRAIDATVQDAALTPPSTVGESGGNGLNWKNGLVGFCVTFKQMAPTALKVVHAFFMRYGYKVQQFVQLDKVENLLCCKYFSYWKLLETYVTCVPANESERQTIRGVFEKGVTLWATPEAIGTADPDDNEPISKKWW